MLHRKLIALCVPVLMAAMLATGCSTTKTAVTGEADKVKYEVIATGNTQDRLKVLNVALSNAGDLPRASVEIQNDSNFSWTFQYRIKWYDNAGMEINPDGTAWTPVGIMAHESKSLQSVAPNPTGETFKLFLQEKAQ